MRNQSACKRKVSNQAKSSVCKEQKFGENQPLEEIISREELAERNGIIGNKTVYFSMYLQLFFEGQVVQKRPTIRQLAQHIYSQKELYTRKGDGYKLLEFSSIATDLNTLSKLIREKLKNEKNEMKKNKSKYY